MRRKVISYSLFKGMDPLAELFYVRGLYFNVLMNSIIYPSWQTVFYFDDYIVEKYGFLILWLRDVYGVKDYTLPSSDYTHCQKMLMRMIPCFWEDVEYVICRDADALTSYREAQAVHQWIDSGLVVHSIHDNNAHTVPVMGGLCGFKAEAITNKYISFFKMLSRSNVKIDKHGTDQDFLTSVIYNDFKKGILLHNFRGTKNDCELVIGYDPDWSKSIELPDVDKRFWTSNLCSFFIGAAGCNEMETLRFFRDLLPVFKDDNELWLKYPKIFYWYD